LPVRTLYRRGDFRIQSGFLRFSADRFECASAGYLHQPAAERLRLSQTGQSLVSSQESILRHVFRQVVIAQNGQRHGADRPFVTVDKYGKSLLAAVKNGIYEFCVCSHVTTFLPGSASTIKSKLEEKMRQEKGFFSDGLSLRRSSTRH
jgi:hypothetical protein